MKTEKNQKSTGFDAATVVSSMLSPKLTKAQLIEVFKKELKRRDGLIMALKTESKKLETELIKSQALSRSSFAQIENLQYRVNVFASSTAQIRRIETLEQQLEMVKNEANYYKMRMSPFKTLVMGFYSTQKTCFGKFWLPMN